MKVRLFNSNLERVAVAVFTVNSYFRIELREVQVLALILARVSRKASVPRILQMQVSITSIRHERFSDRRRKNLRSCSFSCL